MENERMVEVDYDYSGRRLSNEAQKTCDLFIGVKIPLSAAESSLEEVWEMVGNIGDISIKNAIQENVTFFIKDYKTGERIHLNNV